jgi:hypothetical protein
MCSKQQEEATAELAETLAQFIAAVWRMDQFRQEAASGFEESAALNMSIVAKLGAALRDEPAPSQPDEVDLVGVEFKRDEAEALLKASEFMHANTSEHFPEMLAEMCLVTLFARYDAFFSDVLTCVYRSRPELLKSGKQVTYEAVLGADSLEELRDELIHREIQDWRLSLRGQLEEAERRFGIEIAPPHDEAWVLIEASERRNLLVHKGGRVDTHYLRAVPSSRLEVGLRLSVDDEYCEAISGALVRLAHRVATEFSSHCLGHELQLTNEIMESNRWIEAGEVGASAVNQSEPENIENSE